MAATKKQNEPTVEVHTPRVLFRARRIRRSPPFPEG